jgi:hypothetical protein
MQATITSANHEIRVEVSKVHEGQIVTPVVSARRENNGLRVSVYWYDASDQTHIRPAAFERGSDTRADRAAADAWLRAQGVSASLL